MASAPATIARLVAPALIEEGFTRKGQNFYRQENDSVLVVNIQPSRMTAGPYINLGVFYRRYGAESEPNIASCHVFARLLRLVPDMDRLERLVNLSNDIPESERRAELQTLVRGFGVPWLNALSKFEGAKAFLATGPYNNIAPVARPDLMPTSKTSQSFSVGPNL
jgi:hypothetical protein